MPKPKSPYRMTLSLNVLNHLGLNLYSNVSAVLSEVVANAWDADAETVRIKVEEDRITITDDGHGMNLSDINAKFLMVGYRRRDVPGGGVTPKHKRPVMGRKGIGKLSLFSIANQISIYSKKSDKRSAFAMDVTAIKKVIANRQATYHPVELKTFPADLKRGTRIVLTGLKKSVLQTRSALIKRLARRFSVLGAANKFQITVGAHEVSIADRDYFKKIQFLWTLGEEDEDIEELCGKTLEHHEKRDGIVTKGKYSVTGWIGTVRESGALKDDKENLNKILVMVRGKLAQEDVLDAFNDGGMYTKYLIGEIHADFLDVDSEEDIATSSRQKIIEDDPRYIQLLAYLRRELKHVQNQWTKLRNEEGAKKALQIAVVKKWFDSLPTKSRTRAKSLFGKINQLTIDSEEDRKRLFKHSILAFESLRYRENLEALDSITADNLPAFAEAFSSLDDFEATLYYQIVSERVQIINVLQSKVKTNALERVIQGHVFDHLWLLDPSWERAATTEYMEQQVQTEFDKIDAGLTADEKKARLDVKYRTTSGKHVVIELKRADRVLDSNEVSKQAAKYNSALKKLLAAIGLNQPIEIVVVVGKRLKDWDEPNGQKESAEMLAAKNTRVVMYSELIQNAHQAYSEFLTKKKEASRVFDIIQSIDAADFA